MKSFSGKVYFLDSIALECKLTPFLLFRSPPFSLQGREALETNVLATHHRQYHQKFMEIAVIFRMIQDDNCNAPQASWKMTIFHRFSATFSSMLPMLPASIELNITNVFIDSIQISTPLSIYLFSIIHSPSIEVRSEERNPSIYSASKKQYRRSSLRGPQLVSWPQLVSHLLTFDLLWGRGVWCWKKNGVGRASSCWQPLKRLSD